MRIWTSALVFLAVAAAAMAATEIAEIDSNGDGKPDQWYETQNGQVVQMRADRNGDGKVDYLARFGKADQIDYEEYDFNYDGAMDDFYFYTGGVLIRQEVDTNFDGKVDLWVYLYRGIYVERYERDTDFDGKKDQVKDFGKS